MFYLIQKLYVGPIRICKNGLTKNFVFAKIFAKNLCPRSLRLCQHDVSVVNDYADTMSAYIVNDYVDIMSAYIVNDYADIVSA